MDFIGAACGIGSKHIDVYRWNVTSLRQYNKTTHTVALTAGSIVSVKIVTQASTTAGYFSVGMKCD
jgi:hypothetical protein